jgi:hypothetical protein
MKEGYSLELFEKLYKEITPLKKKLAYEIDHRRYGVTRDIIESWFDDKFIFVFNKHFNNLEEGHLKGTLINSLKTFKVFYSNTVDLEGESMLINYIADKEDITTGELFLDIATEFMKKELSDNAFMLLNLQLNPPPFILNRITKSNSNIPIYLILEYFGLDNIAKNIKMIRNLRKEINNAIEKAKLELNPA